MGIYSSLKQSPCESSLFIWCRWWKHSWKDLYRNSEHAPLRFPRHLKIFFLLSGFDIWKGKIARADIWEYGGCRTWGMLSLSKNILHKTLLLMWSLWCVETLETLHSTHCYKESKWARTLYVHASHISRLICAKQFHST